MALAPGGVELPRWWWVPILGPPPISGGPPADAGTPQHGAQPGAPIVELGAVQTSQQLSGGAGWGFCLTPCASAAGAWGGGRRPPTKKHTPRPGAPPRPPAPH